MPVCIGEKMVSLAVAMLDKNHCSRSRSVHWEAALNDVLLTTIGCGPTKDS